MQEGKKGTLLGFNQKNQHMLFKIVVKKASEGMMLRELAMNSIEAASQAPEGKRRILIKAKAVEECGEAHNKLAIWNPGPGMSSHELNDIFDLGSSLGKKMGPENNFGMGAKMASLASNRVGLRYRSCKDGVVSQVIICWDEEQGGYIKRPFPLVDGIEEEVIDVTEKVREEGEYDLKEDWTEVVLFGNHRDQDTVKDPYNGAPQQERNWIPTTLYHRFYRLSAGVEIFLCKGTHTKDRERTRPFKTIPQRLGDTEEVKKQTVDAGKDIRIHYYYDPPYPKHPSHNTSAKKWNLASSAGTCAIVYKNEMYDLRKSRKWAWDAPKFGIDHCVRQISIHIELPDDHPVTPTLDRTSLKSTRGKKEDVQVEDFSELVIRHCPDWLIKIIEKQRQKPSSSMKALKKKLQERLDKRNKSLRRDKEGEEPIGGGEKSKPEDNPDDPEDPKRKRTSRVRPPEEIIVNPKGTKRATISKNRKQAPDIELIYKDELIEQNKIASRAARYVSGRNKLFVNMKYTAVEEAKEELLRRFHKPHHDDPEKVQSLCREQAELIVIERVGVAVVDAQRKHRDKAWSEKDVEKALEPESLTLAADSWEDNITSASHRLSQKIRSASKTGKAKGNGVALSQQPEHRAV